jgi:hypothetical protein
MIRNRIYPQLPFWVFTFAIVIALTLPILIADGMFMDGMLYSSVSHNLSQGIGSFWFPQFSKCNMSGLTSFHEQPPLVFGIESFFFKILGDSMYTERIYTFLTMCLTAFLINSLWKLVCKEESQKRMGWLPIMLWIITPLVFWSYSNNMQENTMGLFTLSSSLVILKSLRSSQFRAGLYLLAGVFVFLATLCKGVPGLFTISIPFLYWLSTRQITLNRALASTGLILLVLIVVYGVLLLFETSRESLSLYVFKRLMGRISNEHTANNRFHIWWDLLSNLLPLLGMLALICIWKKTDTVRRIFKTHDLGMILFLILTGLAGSAPLVLTLVQSGFYMVPAFPFFALGIGLLISPLLAKPIEDNLRIRRTYFRSLLLSAVLLASVLLFSCFQAGKPGRDQILLHDVAIVGKEVPKFSTIGIYQEMWKDWSLQCYLERYYNISLDPLNKHAYYLVDRNKQTNPPAGYKKMNLGTEQYDLYRKENKKELYPELLERFCYRQMSSVSFNSRISPESYHPLNQTHH